MPKKHSQSNKVRKRKHKDLDQVDEDLRPEKAAKLSHQPVDYDLPGDAQFYCIECSRYFIDAETLEKHRKTKGKIFKICSIFTHTSNDFEFQCTRIS
jgi:bud site selection protein 20